MAMTKFKMVSVEDGKNKSVDFGSTVINASVAVQGFDVAYSGDHHVRSIDVKASMNGISGSSVTVSATCKMRDDSNHVGTGPVDILVIAECDS